MGDNVSFKVFLKGTDEDEVSYNHSKLIIKYPDPNIFLR